MNERIAVMSPDELDEAIWRDAWRIAWIGAANPTACARVLARYLSARTQMYGTRDAGKHMGLQAIAGQLGYLMGSPEYALGPSDDALRAVQEHARELELDVS